MVFTTLSQDSFVSALKTTTTRSVLVDLHLGGAAVFAHFGIQFLFDRKHLKDRGDVFIGTCSDGCTGTEM